MLKRVALAFVITAVVLGFVDWTSFTIRCAFENPIPTNTQYQPEKHSTENSCPYLGLIGAAINLFISLKPDEWTAFATIVIAVFTSVLGIFTICLSNSTRIAADAAKLNAQAVIDAERAHLFISIAAENIVTLIRSAAVTPSHMEDEPIPALRLGYTLKNYGKTPALIRNIEHGVLIAQNIPEVRNLEPLVDLPNHILAGGETTNLIDVIDLPRVTIREARSILGAERTFWFYGVLVYDDTFGWRRTLKFVWHYGADSNGLRVFDYQETEDRAQKDQ